MNTRFLIALFLISILAPSAWALTLLVPSEYPTIQAGVDAAAVGDSVLLDPGLYFGDGNRDIDFDGKDITVMSRDNDPATCIIACQGYQGDYHRGFIFQSGESNLARVQGITITEGWVQAESGPGGGGGAILCTDGSSPTITHCRLTNCDSEGRGGGLSVFNSNPVISDCRIDHNSAGENGGGAYFWSDAAVVISNCQIDNNRTWGLGGGLYLYSPSSLVFECIVAENNDSGVFSPENVTVLSSTISHNDIGLSVHNHGTLENCLITFNYIAFDEYLAQDFYFGNSTLACCNVFGNEIFSWYELFEYQPGTHGNLSLNPVYCDADNWDFHLAPDSPCLDSYCGRMGALGAGTCSPMSSTPLASGSATEILDNYPNPFNPSTRIRFVLEQDSRVHLRIMDLAGRCVRTLVGGQPYQAGEHALDWNGKDDQGRSQAAGIYLAILEHGEGTDTHRMVLLK